MSILSRIWRYLVAQKQQPRPPRYLPQVSSPHPRQPQKQSLTLVTWNVNAARLCPRARIAALLSHILALTPAADVIFLQEVSRLALSVIMEDPRIRACWFSTDVDDTHWSSQPFATVTLLSRTRFHRHPDHVLDGSCMVLGRVWRIKYPSRYDRDALCCDVHVVPPLGNDGGSRKASACIRLVNVHLDSLAIRPSHRPAQLAAVASAVRDAGCGVVAGDFNPVLPEDQTLVADNGLVDAWVQMRGQTHGYTWGADGGTRHGPRRLDKVAMTGLDVEAIDVLHPGVVSSRPMGWSHRGDNSESQASPPVVPWSDHSGLRCTFSWPGTAA
ncbi:hypothetical protein ACRALDRAFT_1077862 [Sodiomyces alcalophilus JCM 7366]|uniref:uncharacterized protein n=1 Tax=Sodiomyces alcalophilus JCM 7366 TaxID=591952 RepID=UPI0039B6B50C